MRERDEELVEELFDFVEVEADFERRLAVLAVKEGLEVALRGDLIEQVFGISVEVEAEVPGVHLELRRG